MASILDGLRGTRKQATPGHLKTWFKRREQHYAAFLREVGAGIAAGRIRYREDFVDGLERAPEAFIGMLEGRNFGKLIVRVDG